MYSLSRKSLVVVFGAVIFWTVYATLTQYNLDGYGDMVENYAWGMAWQFGYFKHPPMFGWITAAWFWIFPRTDSAYYLLSAVNAELAILVGLLISRRFLNPGQQFLSVLLAQFLPAFGFLAIKYNATVAMLPFWALSFLFYMRLLEYTSGHASRSGNKQDGDAGPKRFAGIVYFDAVALGLFGGIAMLTKYHSAAMILTLGLFTLVDRDARALLRAPAAWIAIAISAAVFLPHSLWLWGNNFITLTYAANQGGGTLVALVAAVVFYFGAFAAYSSPPFLYLMSLRRPDDGQPLFAISQVKTLFRDVRGRALLAFAAGPLVITALLGLAVGTIVSDGWTLPYFVPVPILLTLMLPEPLIERRRLSIIVVPLLTAFVLIAGSPLIKRIVLSQPRFFDDLPVARIAAWAEETFADRMQADVKIAGGVPVLSNGLAFYSNGRVLSVTGNDLVTAPWVTEAMIERDGAVYFCVQTSVENCTKEASVFLKRIDATADFVGNAEQPGAKNTVWNVHLIMRGPAHDR